jgi:Branched-chain amino acid transport system / permease component
MLGQQLVNALSLGCVYALFALGFTLIFGVSGVINLSNGAVFMVVVPDEQLHFLGVQISVLEVAIILLSFALMAALLRWASRCCTRASR